MAGRANANSHLKRVRGVVWAELGGRWKVWASTSAGSLLVVVVVAAGSEQQLKRAGEREVGERARAGEDAGAGDGGHGGSYRGGLAMAH